MKEYIVLSRQNGTTKTGAPFATLKVADKEEVLNVAVWELGPQQEPVVGRIVSFYTLKDNQGKKSCNAMDIKNGPMPDPSHPLYDLLPRPITMEVWTATIDHLVSYCTDTQLIEIIREFGEKLYKPYSEFPYTSYCEDSAMGQKLTSTPSTANALLPLP